MSYRQYHCFRTDQAVNATQDALQEAPIPVEQAAECRFRERSRCSNAVTGLFGSAKESPKSMEPIGEQGRPIL